MRQAVEITQWITFLVIVCETWLVFRKMRNQAHYYLFMNSIALVLYSVGSLIMLYIESEEACFIALLIIWSGKIGTVVFILFFCIAFFEHKLSFVKALGSGMAVITCVMLLTTKKTGLFYRDLHFVTEKGLTIAAYIKGPWYKLWSLTIVCVILACLIMLVNGFVREKNIQKRRQYLALLYALLLEFLIGLLTTLPIGKYYDFNQFGYLMSVVIVMFSMFRNDFMNTEILAKDYIIDELSAGVVAMSKNNTVAYCNKTALQIFPDIMQDEKKVIAQIESSIHTAEPLSVQDKLYVFEERELGKNSSDESKLYVMIDSTKHYQHLKELEREKQNADAANRAKSEFLANMSHEIRTPINVVLGMDEMILRESSEPSIREYATDIKAAGHTLLTIVNDILDLNKIESGKMEIVPAEYDAAGMVYDLSNMIRLRAEDKKLEFHVSVSSEIPQTLWGDDVRIRQIIMNLLTNAVKYTQRGKIWLRVSVLQRRIEEHGEEVLLHFEVEDTGIGIKPEDMDKLFSEFERIETERNRNIEGTGLGIPITHKLLAMMGAELKVESEYGKGSLFSFDLRQKVVEKASEKEDSNNITESAGKPCGKGNSFIAPEADILLVDDNAVNRKVFTALLKKTQIRITEADSGYKAIELANEQKFDLIFMDHMMPGMDGIEAMKSIKSAKDCPSADVPVIVLTVNAIEGSKEKYLEAGFDGYLSKPIIPEQLLCVMAEQLPEDKVSYL